MPKTKHPKDVIEHERLPLQALHFSMRTNEEQGSNQASVTYRVEAQDNTSLGSHGETMGFAKQMVAPDKELRTASRLFKNSADAQGDAGLITRQVASNQADKLLGLNVITEEKYGVDKDGKVIGVSIQADGCNVVGKKGVLQVDCRDPRIQKGLSDLQVIDFINGETDRHAGNIFIDPATGKVTGIDNDLCLPERAVGGQALDKMVGMPKIMHEDTAKRILEADPEKLRAMLSTPPPKNGPKPLSKDAIDGAVNRLKALQTELQTKSGAILVVKSFNDSTHRKAMDDANESFLKQQKTSMSLKAQFEPKSMDDFMKMTEADRAKIPHSAIDSLDTTPKTSYLATVEMELAKNKILTGEYVLPEHTNAPTAKRQPDIQLEKELADGYQKMSTSERKNFDKAFERLNKMEEQLDAKKKHLDDPSMTDRFKSIFKGKQEVHDQKEQHANDLANQIAQLKDSLIQSARKLNEEIRQDKAFSNDASSTKSSLSSLVSHTSSSQSQSQSQSLDSTGHTANGTRSETEEALQNSHAKKSQVDTLGNTSPDLSEHLNVRQALDHQHGEHPPHPGTKVEVSKDHQPSVRDKTHLEVPHNTKGEIHHGQSQHQ